MKKKIIYGVCGIGLGHAYRQLPIIEHLSKNNTIVIFAYDRSYEFYSSKFRNNRSITVEKVSVPFYVGDSNGLNFADTISHPYNKGKDFLFTNLKVLSKVSKRIGKPDLVISDYEPISASYAYSLNVPLITIDQQSKYLYGKFPERLNEQSFKDEVERLMLFFPKTYCRIACSFFKVNKNKGGEKVIIFPPVIREDILKIKRKTSKKPVILVYISSQRDFIQNFESVIKIFNSQEATFHIFMKDFSKFRRFSSNKIVFHSYGDNKFEELMKTCNGIVSTAGHTLLSEAMYLGIPVYAVPLPLYEQQMNASVIEKNKFGISYPTLDKAKLSFFINNLAIFNKNIKKDTKVLLRKPGQFGIIKYIETNL